MCNPVLSGINLTCPQERPQPSGQPPCGTINLHQGRKLQLQEGSLSHPAGKGAPTPKPWLVFGTHPQPHWGVKEVGMAGKVSQS